MKVLVLTLTMAFTCLIFLIVSCRKDASTIEADAVIYNTGSLANDGCDWMIKTSDGTYYHPDNLNDNFKIDKQSVHVTYTVTKDRFQCGMLTSNVFTVIHLKTIRKN